MTAFEDLCAAEARVANLEIHCQWIQTYINAASAHRRQLVTRLLQARHNVDLLRTAFEAELDTELKAINE